MSLKDSVAWDDSGKEGAALGGKKVRSGLYVGRGRRKKVISENNNNYYY